MGGVFVTMNSWQIAVLISALALVQLANGTSKGPKDNKPLKVMHLDRVLTLQNNIKPISYNVDLSLAQDPNNLHSLNGTVDIVLELGKMESLSIAKKTDEFLWKRFWGEPDEHGKDIEQQRRDNLRDRIARPDGSNYIILNAGNLEIESASLLVASSIKEVDASQGNWIRVKEVWYGKPGTPIAFGLKKDMPANSYGKLSLVFKSDGKSDRKSGLSFGRSGPGGQFVYGSFDSRSKRSNLFPCFEHAKLERDFKLAVTVPAKYGQVVSIMPVEDRQPVAGTESTTTTFRTTSEPVRMSQLSLAFGHFDEPPLVAKSIGGPEIRVLTARGHRDEAKFALNLATRSIDWLQKYTGVEHPSKTIFLVGSPSVEAWTFSDGLGMVTLSLESLLVHEGMYSIERKTHVAFGVGLAMARQWFGIMKRVDESRERWLIEGIAAHITLRMMEELEPSLKISHYLRTKILAASAKSDQTKSSVRAAYNQYNKPIFKLGSQKFQLIRGASIIQMYERYILGDANKFDSLIRSLVAGPELIDTSQLVAAAAESGKFSRDSIELFFWLWTRVDRAPVVRLFVNDQGRLSAKQDCLYDSTTGICEQFWPLAMTMKFSNADGTKTEMRRLPSLGFEGPDHTIIPPNGFDLSVNSSDYVELMVNDDSTLAYYRATLPRQLVDRIPKGASV